ncbi:DUF5687 family protein [Salegentibacter sp. F188]|uniref:DUF5687 family protein n=1 Tax=Autumnicola patrickiae TaxID=3075591 RepID=A0ABU3E139_9FLAO|nr:DUF5687 family protein [Salegentibacter sp. F188]MDT0689635.1 DUF5687 family protein [Salegentibacter sp. F188]
MFKLFFSLEWKAFFRSASFGKSIGLKIFLLFMALYFAGSFLVLGIGLYPMLKEFYPDQDPLEVVNRYVLLWLLGELIFRFLLQTLPVIDIKPLLNQPIPKRKVVNFVLAKSLYSFYNILPLFVIIPFGIFCMVESDYATIEILAWMLAAYSLSLCVNFTNFILKKRFTDDLKALIPFIIVVAVLAALDYFGIFQITVLFGEALNFVVAHPYLAFVPVILLVLLYKWNQLNLEKKFYLDANLKQKAKAADTSDFVWTRKFGSIAPFLQQDLKLIWRNKRPKTTVYLALFFVFYGLIFYKVEEQEMSAFIVMIGILITGMFMMNFGQFIPGWDSSYYSMIMAQNIPLKQYLASKAGLITFSVVVLAILSTPYVYFGWNILLLNMVCAVYNIGVNVPLLLYAGSFNKKRIDLDKSPFMNYQGTGAAQWLVALPLMIIPMLIFWVTNKFLNFNAALGILAFLGLIGLFLRSKLLDFLAGAYKKRKYAMIQGFKQSGE